MNLLKPVCIAGAKAKAEGKKKSDNPYSEISQAHRRWNRGYDNAEAISKKLNPAEEVAVEEAPKKKRAPRKKKVEVAEA